MILRKIFFSDFVYIHRANFIFSKIKNDLAQADGCDSKFDNFKRRESKQLKTNSVQFLQGRVWSLMAVFLVGNVLIWPRMPFTYQKRRQIRIYFTTVLSKITEFLLQIWSFYKSKPSENLRKSIWKKTSSWNCNIVPSAFINITYLLWNVTLSPNDNTIRFQFLPF